MQIRHLSTLLVWCLPGTAAPTTSIKPDNDGNALPEPHLHSSTKRQFPDAQDYGGIDWEQVLDESVCSVAQRNILLQTAKNVYEWYGENVLGVDESTSPAFERFFGGRLLNHVPQPTFSWFGQSEYKNQAERQWAQVVLPAAKNQIQVAQRVAYQYPAQGNSKSRRSHWKVMFLCESAERVPGHCASSSGIQAYTTQNDGNWPTDRSDMPYTITFCDRFFDNRYLEDIIADGPAPDLFERPTPNLAKLVSYEHVLYHEYHHVKWFGQPNKIVDLTESLREADDFAVSIYGDIHTSAFARKYYDTNSSVNPLVSISADNYAWYATNVQVRSSWGARNGWGPDNDPFDFLDEDEYAHLPKWPRPNPGTAKRQDAADDFDGQLDLAKLFRWPRNCMWSPDQVNTVPNGGMCEWFLDDYDDWVESELGTTLSDECQYLDMEQPYADLNAIHPHCTCTEDETGEELRLYGTEECRGYVGVLIGCQEADREGCACYTSLNDGPFMVNKEDAGIEDCKVLSRGMTDADVQDLIDSRG